MEILTSLDNLVIYVESVEKDTFYRFCNALSKLEALTQIPQIHETIGYGYSEYHYNVNIGRGDGAIYIGYKHNTCKEGDIYTMRVEFNPSKQSKRDYEAFWSAFKRWFMNYPKLIKQLDIAFDLACNPEDIISTSLTGRQRSTIKDTTYFGVRGKSGRLKIYNKKKEIEERVKVKDLFEPGVKMTRIEYTWKFNKAVTPQILSKETFDINNQYELRFLDLDKQSGEMKAFLIAYHEKRVQWKEFTRTTKKKIKEALKSMIRLDLDKCYINARPEIMAQIMSYLS